MIVKAKGSGEMRSSDRTLLANLGFADIDKGNSEHDMACQYLADPAIAPSIIRRMFRGGNGWDWGGCQSNLEVPITKGEGQYRTMIGFADVVTVCEWHGRKEVPVHSWNPDGPKEIKDAIETFKILFEVKIHPCSVGDVMRQLKLYRDYVHPNFTAYVSKYEVDQYDIEALGREKIIHIRLGAGFDEYRQKRQSLRVAGRSLEI